MTEALAYSLTSRTYVALAIARGLAAAHGHADLTAAHVALGVLREGENPAVAALQHGSIRCDAVRRDLEAVLPPRGHPRREDVTVPATAGEARLLAAAAAEAHGRGSAYLGTEHLLLAILREEDTPAAQAFVRHGFTAGSALRHLDAAFGTA